MNGEGNRAAHVFISYPSEDSATVDKLMSELEAAGIPVWRDTEDLWPGEDWSEKIRHAITEDAFAFIACFSRNSVERHTGYQHEELSLAVDQIRRRGPGISWFFPVRLDDCDILDYAVTNNNRFSSYQYTDLFGHNYDRGIQRLIAALLRINGQDHDVPGSGTSTDAHSPSLGDLGQTTASAATAIRALAWLRQWLAVRLARAVGVAAAAVIVVAVLYIALRSHPGEGASPTAPVIGDARTADPCSLTTATAFTRFGDVSLSTDYGNFNRCDVFVQSSGGSLVDIEVQLEIPGWYPDPSLTQKPPPGEIKVVRKPDSGSACDRALILPDQNLVLIAAKQHGTGQADLCAMADTQTRVALAVLHRAGVPRRAAPFPRASLAGLKACSLLGPKMIDDVPGIPHSIRTQGFADWECQWDSDSTNSYVKLLFDQGVPLDSSDGQQVRLRGRMTYVQPDDDGQQTCVAQLVYRQYTDAAGQPTQERLRLTVGGDGPTSRLCDSVTRLADASTAHLAR